MSPLAIKTLLDIWACPSKRLNTEGLKQLDYSPPIIKKAANPNFNTDHGYEVTARGAALVEKLCSIEPPREVVTWEFEE